MPDDRKLNAIPIPVRPLLFSADQDWIAFLPKPGVYQHGLYGELDFSPARLANILANFNANTYGQQLPINAEHDSAASGAVGWIADMRLAADGSLEVKPEWNERGTALLAGDRFRYVSAEFFDRWQDPVTGEWHDDVAVGLAICTRPHFKTDVLRPLAASEEAAMADAEKVPEPVRMTGEIEQEEPVPEKEPKPTPQPEPNPTPPEPAPTPEPEPPTEPEAVTLNEQAVREFREMQRKFKQMSDELAKVKNENVEVRANYREKKFTDEVRGRSDDNDRPWFGDIEDHVSMLMDLSEKFGDASPQVQNYIKQNRATAEALRQTNLFREFGTGRSGEIGQAYGQLESLARERMKTSGETFSQAFDHVFSNEHELRAAYSRERG